jgi:uncharacterized repeat protein (TIGR01451 family)
MKTNKIRIKSSAWALLAGASALLLAASLPLLLSHFQALAQPAAEVTVANLEVQKGVNTALAAPGDTLTYTIAIQNTGDELTDAWLTDTLPVELTCIADSLSATLGSFGVQNNVITWTAEMYGHGYTAVISFSAQISPEITYAEIENTAWVTGTGELITDSAPTTVGTFGNLDNADTYKSVSSNEAEPGDVLTYTIQVFNSSYTATVNGAWLTDTLHPALTFLPGSLSAGLGDAGFANGVITWTHDVGIRQFVELRFSAQISPDLPYNGWITNTVEIVAPLQSFTRSVGTNVHRGYPHLEASKSVYPDWVHPGERLTYTVHIVNTGNGSVETAWMTDVLPSEVNYVPGSLDATTGDFGEAGDVITWTGSLVPSEEATIVFAVETLPDLENNTRFINTAEITGAGSLVQAPVEAAAITTFEMIFPIIFYNYPPIPKLDPIPTPVDHSYTVSWYGVETDVDHYVLQQARDSGFSSPEQVWTTTLTSQVVEDVYCAHYYRVRADKASDWGQGQWSSVKSGISSAPDAPVLNDIPDPGDDNSYTVSWSFTPIDGAVTYVLQESTDAGFSSITGEWQTTATSKFIQKGSTSGTFYYRVRADDNDCWGQGPWSETKSVEAKYVYFDDFSNSGSGWPIVAKEVIPETDTYYRLRYHSGQYRIMIDPGGPPIWFHQPDALAPYKPPSDKYCVEVKVRFVKGQSPYQDWNWYPYWGNGGLAFGVNAANTNLYAVCLSVGGGDSMGWFVVNNPGYEYPYKGCNYIDGVVGGEPAGALDITQWHLFQVSVNGDWVTVYIDGVRKGKWKMDGLSATTRVGVVGGDYEITPVDLRFDNFKVIPNVGCTP